MILDPHFPDHLLHLVHPQLALLGRPLGLPTHLLDQLSLLHVRLAGRLKLPLDCLGVPPLGLQLGLQGYDLVVQLLLGGLEQRGGLEVVLLGGQLAREVLDLGCEV